MTAHQRDTEILQRIAALPSPGEDPRPRYVFPASAAYVRGLEQRVQQIDEQNAALRAEVRWTRLVAAILAGVIWALALGASR